jgi:NAD(P)-dependent dehydrogenase (short-subunit alcohol dehydrogenase family)
MESGLGGKRALVTGGGSGIGRGIALALAAEGANVAIASRSEHPDVIAEIRAHGVAAAWIEADVSRESDIDVMIAKAMEQLGGLDLYINNVAGTWHEPITRLTSDAWHRTLDTNLLACVFACREIARRFIAQGHGCILIVGSTAAHVPLYQETAYRASKAGLKVVMEVMAIELAPFGIRVNLLTPGLFFTPLVASLPATQTDAREIPLRRSGRVDELGGAAILLLSDRLSSYTTGSEFVVDGGVRLRPMNVWDDEQIRRFNEPR